MDRRDYAFQVALCAFALLAMVLLCGVIRR